MRKYLEIFCMCTCTLHYLQAMSLTECKFWKAIANRNTAVVDNLVSGGYVDVNKKNPKGEPPIEIAAFTADICMFEALSRHANLDINAQSSHSGRTALHIAAARGNLVMVKWLVERGADVNLLDKHAEPPLYFSDKDKSGEVTKYLKENGADESKKKGEISRLGFRPFYKAIALGEVPIVLRMLQDGADPNVIHWCCGKDYTPLYCSVVFNRPAITFLLLQYGASMRDDIMTYANASGNAAVNDILLKRGNFMQMEFPLHVAAEIGNIVKVCELLKMGVDPNGVKLLGEEKLTPLHYAALLNKPAVAKILVEHGAKIVDGNTLIHSPLHFCVVEGNIAVAKILLNAKPGVIYMKDAASQNTLFHLAASSYSEDLLKIIFNMDSSMDVDEPNSEGNTPLMIVTSSLVRSVVTEVITNESFIAHIECINFFMEHGASLNKSNGQAQNPRKFLQTLIDILELEGDHDAWLKEIYAIHGFYTAPINITPYAIEKML